MANKLGHVTLLVKDYDEAIQFYADRMGFEVVTDNAFGGGFRWVTVAPAKDNESAIVFVQADTPEKPERVGTQASNHVFFTLQTNDCQGDYERMKSKGVRFFGEPKQVPWGVEVVFEDL